MSKKGNVVVVVIVVVVVGAILRYLGLCREARREICLFRELMSLEQTKKDESKDMLDLEAEQRASQFSLILARLMT